MGHGGKSHQRRLHEACSGGAEPAHRAYRLGGCLVPSNSPESEYTLGRLPCHPAAPTASPEPWPDPSQPSYRLPSSRPTWPIPAATTSSTTATAGRSGLQLPADHPGPVAQLRRRRALRAPARPRASSLRPGRHPVRPGQQLRTAATAPPRRTSDASSPRTSGPTATSWSSPARPAGTCGPARTASSARASTCSRRWTTASRAWVSTTSTSSTRTASTPTRRSRKRWARSTPRSSRARRATSGISSYSRGTNRRGHRHPARPGHAAAHPPAQLLDVQPLDREGAARCPR